MEGFEIVGPSFVVTGNDENGAGRGGGGDPPADRVLRLDPGLPRRARVHGWGGLQDELNALSKQGEWAEMGELIDDEILNTFAVVGQPERSRPSCAAATAT